MGAWDGDLLDEETPTLATTSIWSIFCKNRTYVDSEGCSVGDKVGNSVGLVVGESVGNSVGGELGADDG